MAYDFSKNQRWKIYFLVNQPTGAPTNAIWYSNDNWTAHAGVSEIAALKNNILAISPIRRSIGGLLDPRITKPQLTVSIDNADDAARIEATDPGFSGQVAHINIGQETNFNTTTYQRLFMGVINPPGVTRWDEKSMEFTMTHRAVIDSVVLPVNKFFPTTYPNVEAKSKFLPIPLVYGDWRTTAGNGETVPCYCSNTTTGTGGRFIIADHALKQIEVVYLNGVDITANCTLDAANGAFTISSTSTYDPDVDTVTANVQGATDDGLTTGTLLQLPGEILNDIIQTHLGVDAVYVNSTQISDWDTNFPFNMRRVINSEQSAMSIVSSLLVDGFADLGIVYNASNGADEYYPVFRKIDTSTTTHYYADDIETQEDDSRHFYVVPDEDRIQLTQIVCDYNYDPVGVKWAGRYDESDAQASILNNGATVRRRLQLNWLYNDADATTRAKIELYSFSSPVEMLHVRLKTPAIERQPTDQFLLTHGKWTATPFQVRETRVDVQRMLVDIIAWNMSNTVAGTWTALGANVWTASTEVEKEQHGFWTDATGYADPSDPASLGYRWMYGV